MVLGHLADTNLAGTQIFIVCRLGVEKIVIKFEKGTGQEIYGLRDNSYNSYVVMFRVLRLLLGVTTEIVIRKWHLLLRKLCWNFLL